jgi:hypothetical protein
MYDEENQYFSMYDLDPCAVVHSIDHEEDTDDDTFFDDIDGLFDELEEDE